MAVRGVRNLEIHAAHACNLRCESCTHYSNQLHKGFVSLDDAAAWMSAWDRRLSPQTFSVLGGEPTLHPDLTGFVRLARRHWPTAHLRLVTNGFFLHRHPDLGKVLGDDPDAAVYVSVHHPDPEYAAKVQPGLDTLARWRAAHGLNWFRYDAVGMWKRTYRGTGADLEPFADGDPRSSWEHCDSKFCTQLFEGKLWKCAPLAYLPMQHAKYGLSEKWSPYLQYRPLSPDCTNAELDAFFNREHEAACGMCPARPESFLLPNPLLPLGLPRAKVS